MELQTNDKESLKSEEEIRADMARKKGKKVNVKFLGGIIGFILGYAVTNNGLGGIFGAIIGAYIASQM